MYADPGFLPPTMIPTNLSCSDSTKQASTSTPVSILAPVVPAPNPPSPKSSPSMLMLTFEDEGSGKAVSV